MSRPRTSIGTFGEIWVESEPGTRVTAYTWFRDNDGRRRKVQATGASRTQAVNLLKEKLARRVRRSTLQVDLSPDSPFLKLVEIWLDDLDLEGHLAPSTRHLYERNMRTLVLPAFKDLTLREITIMRVDRFLKSLAKESYSKAKQAKVVLNLALGLALRYEAIDRNPVAGTKRLRRPGYGARALKLAEIQAIRTAVRSWRRGDAVSGPKPDGQLEAIIELMLGTSGRIGEVLAIRKCDVDVTTTPATVRLSGTIVSTPGRPTVRQDHPKTRSSVRVTPVPSWAATVLRTRLAVVAGEDPEHLLFFTRKHTPLTTNNVRRLLRQILADAGIKGVTPHSFRRTVATTIERAAGADLAAELLGHASTEITKKHYIEPDTSVNPLAAQILEALAPGPAPQGAPVAGETSREELG